MLAIWFTMKINSFRNNKMDPFKIQALPVTSMLLLWNIILLLLLLLLL